MIVAKWCLLQIKMIALIVNIPAIGDSQNTSPVSLSP